MKTKIDQGQKVGYWTILTNIFLVLISFWLGLVVQDMVAKRNADISSVLARVEYVNRIKPSIDSLNIKYNSLTQQLLKDTRGGDTSYIRHRLKLKADSLILYYKSIINTTREVIYYFDESVLDNNSDSSLISKIGTLYDYIELVDFCLNDSAYTTNGIYYTNEKRFEPFGRYYYYSSFKNRINSIYNSPDYISLMGVNVNHDNSEKRIEKYMDGLYRDLVNNRNDSTMLEIMNHAFFSAWDIHKDLNSQLKYKQPEISLIDTLSHFPWSVLSIAIITILLFVSLIFIKTADIGNAICDKETLSSFDSKISTMNTEIELVKSKIRELENGNGNTGRGAPKTNKKATNSAPPRKKGSSN